MGRTAPPLARRRRLGVRLRAVGGGAVCPSAGAGRLGLPTWGRTRGLRPGAAASGGSPSCSPTDRRDGAFLHRGAPPRPESGARPLWGLGNGRVGEFDEKNKRGAGGIQGFKKYGDDQKFLRQGEAVTLSLGFPGMWLGVWGLEHLEEGV